MKTRPITVDDTNKWHAQQHAWLLKEIERARKNREHVVVITRTDRLLFPPPPPTKVTVGVFSMEKSHT